MVAEARIYGSEVRANTQCSMYFDPDKVRLYGLEYELICDSESNKNLMVKELNTKSTIKKKGDLWLAKVDGSIHSNAGCELNTAPVPFEVLCDKLTEAFNNGIFSNVLPKNSMQSCGVHVHVSTNTMTAQQRALFLLFMNKKEHRQFVLNMCDRNSSQRWAMFKEIKYITDTPGNEGRYWMTNESNNNRIEIRGFASSNKLSAMLGKISFVESLINFCGIADPNCFGVGKYIEYVCKNRKEDAACGHLYKRFQFFMGIPYDTEVSAEDIKNSWKEAFKAELIDTCVIEILKRTSVEGRFSAEKLRAIINLSFGLYGFERFRSAPCIHTETPSCFIGVTYGNEKKALTYDTFYSQIPELFSELYLEYLTNLSGCYKNVLELSGGCTSNPSSSHCFFNMAVILLDFYKVMKSKGTSNNLELYMCPLSHKMFLVPNDKREYMKDTFGIVPFIDSSLSFVNLKQFTGNHFIQVIIREYEFGNTTLDSRYKSTIRLYKSFEMNEGKK